MKDKFGEKILFEDSRLQSTVDRFIKLGQVMSKATEDLSLFSDQMQSYKELLTLVSSLTKRVEDLEKKLEENTSVTVEEYAKRKGISEYYVRQLCRNQKLPCKKQGNQWLVSILK